MKEFLKRQYNLLNEQLNITSDALSSSVLLKEPPANNNNILPKLWLNFYDYFNYMRKINKETPRPEDYLWYNGLDQAYNFGDLYKDNV